MDSMIENPHSYPCEALHNDFLSVITVIVVFTPAELRDEGVKVLGVYTLFHSFIIISSTIAKNASTISGSKWVPDSSRMMAYAFLSGMASL